MLVSVSEPGVAYVAGYDLFGDVDRAGRHDGCHEVDRVDCAGFVDATKAGDRGEG